MCTAISFNAYNFYFGRTLDYEHTFGENITITPRNFSLNFADIGVMDKHYAIIGMAHIADNYPLYYDALNEKGLCIAALNFVGNAHYFERKPNKDNVAHFEVILWLLGQCATVAEAKIKLKKLNITNRAFSPELPKAQLHWLIADKKESITLESTKDGISVHQNPMGVLTNNPPFKEQLSGLQNYMHLSPKPPKNNFSKSLNLTPHSRGMGALGLPGDLSSASRFVRASFNKLNSVPFKTENGGVSQFFHILETVSQIRGCCDVGDSNFEITQYTSCCDADKGIYYYTTYCNRQISGVNMHSENLNGADLIFYPPIQNEQIYMQN
jgi:choloylglycine hydrolase